MEIPAFSMELFQETARAAAAEGCVLLKNENTVLPLSAGKKIALQDGSSAQLALDGDAELKDSLEEIVFFTGL